MAYIEPKTNWNEEYEPSPQDMNRIEGNIKEIKDVEIARVDSEKDAIEARTITAGDGLSGGGTLAGNRTIDVDSTVVRYKGYTTGSVSTSSNYTLPAISVGQTRRQLVSYTGPLGDSGLVYLPSGTLFIVNGHILPGGAVAGSAGPGEAVSFSYWRLA